MNAAERIRLIDEPTTLRPEQSEAIQTQIAADLTLYRGQRYFVKRVQVVIEYEEMGFVNSKVMSLEGPLVFSTHQYNTFGGIEGLMLSAVKAT